MSFTIGEVSKILNIPISTIRYYEQEGMLTFIHRSHNGRRLFEEKDFDTLVFIECLKKTGMSLKNIKKFLHYVSEGDTTITKRLDMMEAQKNIVVQEIEQLTNMLEMLDYKCWYYKTAQKAGTCKIHENHPLENIPKKYYKFLHKSHKQK